MVKFKWKSVIKLFNQRKTAGAENFLPLLVSYYRLFLKKSSISCEHSFSMGPLLTTVFG